MECDGLELSSDFGSLKRLADKNFLKVAVHCVQQHIAGVESSAPPCIDCFKKFCISKVFIGSKHCAMLALSNAFDLLRLNIVRCVAGGCSTMLRGDVTSKASLSAFNRLSFCVNMLGGHCIPWATPPLRSSRRD